jgi:hypothetical protein
MRRIVACVGLAAALQLALPGTAGALTFSGVQITDSPPGGLSWDTFPSASVTAFVKDGGTFLNPADQLISVDVSAPGTYTFDLRLNKGTGREMASFRFEMFFDGSGTAAIDVTAPRDTVGATPPFAGDGVEVFGPLTVMLASVRVSSFQPVDEVAEFTATADGNIDYVGSFTFTVEEALVPEPAGLALGLAACAAAAAGRRRR